MTRRPLQHALDELRFGRNGTLNLRSSLPTATEAVRRTESWLRQRQADGATEALVITGRGSHSFGGVPVVREAVRRLLNMLTTRGVVAAHREHTPGSFVVRLLPLSAGSGRRMNVTSVAEPLLAPPTLEGLSDSTRDRLRALAALALEALGVRDPSPEFIRDEMERQCAQLAGSVAGASTAELRDAQLRAAIDRAIDRLDEELR